MKKRKVSSDLPPPSPNSLNSGIELDNPNNDSTPPLLHCTQYTAVSDAFETFISTLANITSRVQSEWDAFLLHRKDLELKVKTCAEISAENVKKVTLNVGGTKFTTTEATLTSEKESFFWVMLTSGHWKPDEDGEYFIDRSPLTMGYILDYLRSGNQVRMDHLGELEQESLANDIDFYQMHSMMHLTSIPIGTIHFMESQDPLLAAKVDVTHCTTSSSLYIKEPTDQFFTTTFPANSLSDCASKKTVKWRVTVVLPPDSLNWPNCLIGIGDAKNPSFENSIFLSFFGLNVWDHSGTNGQALLKWPCGDGNQRVVDWEYDRETKNVTITTNGAPVEPHTFSLKNPGGSGLLAPWCKPHSNSCVRCTVKVQSM
eukprot:TRINITY_DN68001_c12_g2_i1.p1 TRINITY_DN68001_c12_g2~~TRINITY_DN68001_c12_g2_i1.p1  ORF type:complete len:380 (+),score=19.29 TRINITY_DN68001_c12_g2_i1:29-1141(+)